MHGARKFRLRYQEQVSAQTLAEGLDEFGVSWSDERTTPIQ